MGRRKIEIQPITHERNRSVTFLKRKNGLFKKAYELGVLCSVDVAVIIFEERPGHHVKLYQYCSSDIHDIVQRHLRHDGEKDTRGPQDFSGNNSNKLDDGGDGDDDDADDDDDIPSRKRRHDGKLKPPADMVPSAMDYTSQNHRSLSIPQPPLSLHIGGQPAGGGSTLPISNDRSIGMRDTTKRSSRLSLHAGHSRSPSDPVDPGSGNYPYYSGQGSGAFNRPSQYGHHPSQHHGHSQSGPPHHGSSTQYQPFFPVSSSHQSPPPSFIPLQSDFPRGPPSRAGGSSFGLPPRSNSTSSSSYDPPGMYSNMMRNPPPPSSQSSGPGGGPGPGGDLFAAFLDADEQSRHQNQPQQGSGLVGLEWPVHNSGGGGNSASSAPSVPSSAVSNTTSTAPSSAHPEGQSQNNWLDIFSSNSNNNIPPNRDSISWERGAAGGEHRGDISEMFGGDRARAGSSASGGGGLVLGISGGAKRAKVEDESSLGGSVPSPAGLNGRGNEVQKDSTKDVG